jgi:hypothetical protein
VGEAGEAGEEKVAGVRIDAIAAAAERAGTYLSSLIIFVYLLTLSCLELGESWSISRKGPGSRGEREVTRRESSL